MYMSNPVRCIYLYDICSLVMHFIVHIIMHVKLLCLVPAPTLANSARCYLEVFKKQQTQKVAKRNLEENRA